MSLTRAFTPQGGTLTVDTGGKLNVANGDFGSGVMNVTGSLAVDTGGNMNVGSGFSSNTGVANASRSLSNAATGGNIYAIGTGTTLILNGSSAQVLYGPGSGTDALANLNEVTGALTVENGAGTFHAGHAAVRYSDGRGNRVEDSPPSAGVDRIIDHAGQY